MQGWVAGHACQRAAGIEVIALQGDAPGAHLLVEGQAFGHLSILGAQASCLAAEKRLEDPGST